MIRTRSDIFVSPRMVASALTLLLVSMLSACSESDNSWPTEPVAQEQENYQARARSHYTPPGPPEDPWGPYIAEASERFDIPEAWIRAVMHQESGGRLYDSEGHFITSTPGAMGLMQVMPPAYDDLRIKYDLGPDPYDPHDNIMAGTAYMRQMYDIYGSPGFLAAYNYGPGSLDHYLRHNRALPPETRNYVASIAPHIMGIWPRVRSRNDLIVARHDPTARVRRKAPASYRATHPSYSETKPATPTYTVNPQSADTAPDAPTPTDVQNAANAAHDAIDPLHPIETPADRQTIGSTWAARGYPPTQNTHPQRPIHTQPVDKPLRIRSIPLAHAPAQHRHVTDIAASSTNKWAIQIGTYSSQKQALAVATHLRTLIGPEMQGKPIQISPIHTNHGTLYRARLTAIAQTQANNACTKLGKVAPCFVISPNAHF